MKNNKTRIAIAICSLIGSVYYTTVLLLVNWDSTPLSQLL